MKKMRHFLKFLTPIFVLKHITLVKQRQQIKTWENEGRPIPIPHIVKQKIIEQYRKKYRYTCFIETGTYLGDMVLAQKNRFEKVISIELGLALFEKAKEKFKNDKNVTIIQGDSGIELPKILRFLKEPVIFWLDGHYSGDITAKGDTECPILNELEAILDSNLDNYVVLIDDARCFTGVGDYPTIESLKVLIKGRNENHIFDVKDDIIFISK